MATFTETTVALTQAGQLYANRMLAILHVVDECSAAEQRTIRAVAARLKMSKPSVTRNSTVLEEAKLLKRRINPDDRREVWLEVTAAGAKYLTKINNGWSK